METLTDFRAVALAVARRNLTHAFKNPALLVPAALFPLVFLLAFAGGLSAVQDVPGFDYPAGYTAFQFVFVFLQAAAFGGVFTGFAVAADFESGFTQRLLLAAPRRAGLIAGYVLAGSAASPSRAPSSSSRRCWPACRSSAIPPRSSGS
jgi:ABC-2 type transport system permease protein